MQEIFKRWYVRMTPDWKSGCWNWIGSKDVLGYGKFHGPGKNTLAHRASYMLHYGEIPDGMFILHSCDNPSCVNPSHLRIGTHQENMAERNEKGRARGGSQPGELHPMAKLTKEKIGIIREMCSIGVPQSITAKVFGITQPTVSNIHKRQSWSQYA